MLKLIMRDEKAQKIVYVLLQLSLLITLVNNFLYHTFKIPWVKITAALFLLLTLGLLFLNQKGRLPKSFYGVMAFSILLSMYSNFTLYNDILFMNGYFYVMLGLVLGLMLIRDQLDIRVVKISFILISLFIVIAISFKLTLVNSSYFFILNRNSVTPFVFCYGALINLIDYKQGKKRPVIYPSIVVFLVAYLTKSRLSFFVASLYVLGIVVVILVHKYVIFNSQNEKKRKIALIIYGLATLFVVVSILVFIAIRHTRFGSDGVSSSGRYGIYLEFLKELSFKKLVTGFRPSILDHYFDLHQTFLQFIAGTGIFSIPVFALFIWLVVISFNTNILLFLLSLLIFSYSMFGTFMFFFIGDSILIPLFMVTWEARKKITSEREDLLQEG